MPKAAPHDRSPSLEIPKVGFLGRCLPKAAPHDRSPSLEPPFWTPKPPFGSQKMPKMSIFVKFLKMDTPHSHRAWKTTPTPPRMQPYLDPAFPGCSHTWIMPSPDAAIPGSSHFRLFCPYCRQFSFHFRLFPPIPPHPPCSPLLGGAHECRGPWAHVHAITCPRCQACTLY